MQRTCPVILQRERLLRLGYGLVLAFLSNSMPLRSVTLLLLDLGQSDAHSIYRNRSRNGGHLLRAAGFTCRRSVAPAEGARVFISAEDAALWSHHVFSNTSALSYLEWGSGGTTVVAAWRALQAQALGIPSLRVVSMESSPNWLRHLHSRYPVLRQAEANAPLQPESASLEPTGMWGIPMGWTTRPLSLRRQQVLQLVRRSYAPSRPGAPRLGLGRSPCYAV